MASSEKYYGMNLPHKISVRMQLLEPTLNIIL